MNVTVEVENAMKLVKNEKAIGPEDTCTKY